MKKQDVIGLVIILVIVAVLGILAAPKEAPMAIDFSGLVADQRIDFGDLSAVQIHTRSIVLRIYQDTYAPGCRVVGLYNTSTPFTNISYTITLNNGTNGMVQFTETSWTTQSGVWQSSGGLVGTGGWHTVIVTYVGDSVANDPVIYVDGIASSITEAYTPSGTLLEGTDGIFTVGGHPVGTATYPCDGRVENVIVYPFILTADQAAEIHNSMLAYPIPGEVFHPILIGASGLSTFDGAALGGTNTITDPVSGAVGTPHGNPVGAGDTILTWR